MPTHTTLTGIKNLNEPTLSPTIKVNIIKFYDWGFLDKGGYWNIDFNESGVYGGDWSRLRPVNEPRVPFSVGQVWEGKRSNWVWESGVSIGVPKTVSVRVDGSGIPASSYYVDYPRGRIVFTEARAISSTVQAEYSYKFVNIIDARSIPAFKRVQRNSLRIDDGQFLIGSGEHIEFAENRLQLPAIVFNVVSNRNAEPYEIGSFSQVVKQTATFHILAEKDNVATQLADIILGQDDRTILLFSLKAISDAQAWPLDHRGALTNPSSIYPNLVRPTGDGWYRWSDRAQHGMIRFTDSSASNGNWISDKLYQISVNVTTETVLGRN